MNLKCSKYLEKIAKIKVQSKIDLDLDVWDETGYVHVCYRLDTTFILDPYINISKEVHI